MGSSGVVFRAIDSQLNRDVAIKVLRPSLGEAARTRFIAEARATANLDHANIVRIFHVGISESLAYIVMQWLPGETLEQRLQRDLALPHEEVKQLGIQIACGLAVAHQKDLVHRDIKPANLWITEDGDVKILDFGLVRMMDESPQLTCTGMIAGTPCFMSPEQSRGDELDARSDLFSLGCVLYQSLTGKLPFASANALATLQAIQREQPTPPNDLDSSIPTDLSDLVMMLLEKSPHRRPTSADQLAEAINHGRTQWPFECDRYQIVKAKTHSKQSLARPQRLRSGFWPTISIAIMAGVMGFGGWMFGPQIFRIATDQGEIVIETNDPNVQIEVSQGGELVEVIDLRTKQSLQIKSGTYQIQAVDDQNSVSIDKDQLTLTRGETEIVKITKSKTADAMPKESPIAASTDSTSQRFPLATKDPASGYRGPRPRLAFDPAYIVKPGDVLNVFIEHVLGSFDRDTQPPEGHFGYPIPVKVNGTIALPLIDPVAVSGKTTFEIEKQLHEIYTEEILKNGHKPVVSVTVREVFKPTSTAKLSEPVYDGMNFEHCINAIKFERDGNKLMKPFVGLMELSDAKDHPEIVKPLVAAILRIRKVDANSQLETRFAQWLTDTQLQEVTLELGSSKRDDEWGLFSYLLTRQTNGPYGMESPEARWERLKPVREKIYQRIVSAIKENRIANNRPTSCYLSLVQRGWIDPTRNPEATDSMFAFINSETNFNQAAYKFLAVAKTWPSLDGLGLAISRHVSNNWSLRNQFAGNEVLWQKVIDACAPENRKDAVVGYGKAILSENCPLDLQSVNYLAALSDELFDAIMPIYEANKFSNNADALRRISERLQN